MARYLLTDAELRSMTPGTYHDGRGLYCLIRSKTSASWHLRFTVKRRKDLGRQKMGLGPYPTISLARAREIADEYRSVAAEGIDPREHRHKATRRGLTIEQAITELFEKKRHALKGGGTAGRWWSPVANHILPEVGDVGVADISVQMIIDRLGSVYTTKPSTGDKVFTRLKMALDYASAQDDRVDPTIVERAKVQLPRKKPDRKRQDDGHHPALHWNDAPKLWASLGSDVLDTALAFYLLTLPRVSNISAMTWAQVDLKEAIWVIPPENMKTGLPFDAPLTQPALELLRRARSFSLKDSGDLVFPNPNGRKTRQYHVNFLNNRLQRDEWASTKPGCLAVAHGLRTTFRTYLGEHEICDNRMAEMSIQHEVRAKQEIPYNRARLLRQRRVILEKWSDWLLSAKRRQEAHLRKMSSIAETQTGRTVEDVEKWARGEPEDKGSEDDLRHMSRDEFIRRSRFDGLEDLK
ncbi:tyrosine-type recombinase/integrase [Shimia biformata]|uniref:tyrosine-type recombinase/integrase n=1 Tax=Shimia biformata TaxID=1294299 RepID=UPI0023B267A3|nr:site-specific integrase [Shimia biformata]